MPNNLPTMVFFTLIGSISVLLAVFNKQILRWIGIRPTSEIFTNPKYQRSARITERLVPLFMAVFGISFLVQGIGPQFLSREATYTVAMAVSGLSGLIVLAMFVVVLVNWKAK